MDKRSNWREFQAILDEHNIKSLYHYTDRDNVESIIQNGGLFSWADCQERGINISKPGGDDLSHSIEKRCGIDNFVHLAFTDHHPMMAVAIEEGRISNPVILEIDPSILFESETLFSNMRATRVNAHVGDTSEDLKQIHFDSALVDNPSDLDAFERPYFQAEVLIKSFVPLGYITNIESFGIPVEQILSGKETVTTIVTKEDINNGIEDEFGAVYSTDGKRLLRGPNLNHTTYIIRYGTQVVCDRAFSWLNSLTSITIPDSVTHIGNEAFVSCLKLKNVTIPDSVTHIGDEAFKWCEGLTNITISNSITQIRNGVFLRCWCLTSITIPDSVTHIGYEAFALCRRLTNITIPDSVTHIDHRAFADSGLISITIPNSVISIGNEVFFLCEDLSEIHIPNGSYNKFKEMLPSFEGKFIEA